MPVKDRKYNLVKLASDNWVIDTNTSTVYKVCIDNSMGRRKVIAFDKVFTFDSNLGVQMYEGARVPVKILTEAIWYMRKKLFSVEENDRWRMAAGY